MAHLEGGDGSSLAAAWIVRDAPNDAEATAAVLAHLAGVYGGPVAIVKRAPLRCATRRYELLDVRLPGGSRRVSLWFDVTAVPRAPDGQEGPPRTQSGTYRVEPV